MVLDSGVATGSVAGEIISQVCMQNFSQLDHPPVRIAMPDNPEPTSFGLTKHFYPTCETIIESIANMMSQSVDIAELSSSRTHPHDVPGGWFKGPF